MAGNEGDPYSLGRNYTASARSVPYQPLPKISGRSRGPRLTGVGKVYRLAMLHLLIRAQFGYLLHPSIKLPDDKTGLRVADVGAGTG